MSLCLDLSNYDLATLDVDGFKAAGVDRVILGSWPLGDMRAAANKLRAGGIEIIGFYGFIYFGDAGGELRDITAAIALAKDFGVSRVWMDCETDANQQGWHSAPAPTPEERVIAIGLRRQLIEAAGLQPGIYTGAWWWPSATNNSTAFSDLPLWHSAYVDNAGTFSEVRTVNYGGWTDVAIHQWTSTNYLCGKNRDCNTVFEEDDMTPEQVRAIVREEFDNGISAVFRTLTAGYWNPAREGGYTDAQGVPIPPDQEVVDGIAAHLPQGGGGLKRGDTVTLQ